MNTLRRTELFLDALDRHVLRWIAYAAVMGICLITSADALYRYLAGSSVSWAQDVVMSLLMPVLVFIPMGMTIVSGEHIEVDLVERRLPAALRRVLRPLVWLLVLAAWVCIAAVFWAEARQAMPYRAVTFAMPPSVSYGVVAFGASIASLRLLTRLLRSILEPTAADGCTPEQETVEGRHQELNGEE